MTERGEGRLARWSRLKAIGGASEAEDTAARHVDALPSDDATPHRAAPVGFEDLPDPANLPGGIQVRDFVPPMSPLAEAEESEEGGGTSETPPLDGTVPMKEVASDSPERELTSEEEKVVSALPPLESLNKDSDFTPFLADNIPEFIRNRALKILWRSDPLFGLQDGLDDYAENFRVIDKLIDAATQSSYKPGQGYREPEKLDPDEDGETAEASETTGVTEATDVQNNDEAPATSNETMEEDFPQEDGNTAGLENKADVGTKDV